MVALVGLLIEPSPQASVNPHVSADLYALEYEHFPVAPVAISALSAAGAITAGPAAVSPASMAGAAAVSPMGDIYGRVHIIPPTINIGDVTQAVSEPFEVWNAHLDSNNLSSIDGSGTDGMELVGPVEIGIPFTPNESRIYSLNVGVNGAPVIDGVYTFNFATEAPALVVVGRRVIPLVFSPDWARGFTERLEWLTDVLPARNTTEQRIRLRTRPRRTFSYSLLTHSDQGPLFENLLYAWQSRVFGLPAWHQARKLQGAVSAGATAVSIDTTGAEYVAEGMALIYVSPSSYEILRLQSVAAGSLSLMEPTVAAWPAGARIMPLHTGRLPSRVSVRNRTIKVAEVDVVARVDSNNTLAAVPPGLTYRGIPVISKAPNRARGHRDEYLRDWQVTIDNDTGRVVTDDVAQAPAKVREFAWLLNGRDEVEEFKGWLGYLAGRLNAVWIPDRSDDFVLTTTAGAVDTGLRVQQNGFVARVGVAQGRRDIILQLKNGATILRRLVAAVDDGDEQLLTIDSPLGQLVAPEDVLLFSFLAPCRLNSDAVEIFWHTSEAAEVVLHFRGTQDDV